MGNRKKTQLVVQLVLHMYVCMSPIYIHLALLLYVDAV